MDQIVGRYVTALRAVSATAAAGVALVAAVALAGRLSGPVAQVTGRPMPAVTVLALLLGVASYALGHGLRIRAARIMGRLVTLAMIAVVVGGATGYPPLPDPVGRMEPNTAAGLFFAAAGLLLYARSDAGGHARPPTLLRPATRAGAAQVCGLLAILVGLVAGIGLSAGVPGVTGFASWAVLAPATAAAPVLLGIAVLFAQPDRGPVRLLVHTGPGGVLARWLLPVAVGLPPALAAVGEAGQRAGWYSPELWIQGVTLAVVLGFTVAVWAAARAFDGTGRAVRTAEVAAARVSAAHAVAASRLKSQFLATMSHEIRTPINGVTGLSRLLMDTDLEPSQRRYAEGIAAAGQALLAIVDDIFDFSTIEAGRMVLDEGEFDPSRLVEDVVEAVAEQARAKGIELIGYCDPAVPPAVRGDAGRVRQVLLNLAGNAVKFTERGEVVVRARLAGDPAGDPTVAMIRFEVSDTGIGIAAADVDRLFEPFSQADGSSTRRFGGTGLGLAICRGLAELMGGDIGVRSELGSGSTFWCELPLERVPSAVAGRPAAATPRGLRVLVVDDNETSRLVLTDQLRGWSMTPTAVQGGPRALGVLAGATATERPFDVAILGMAGMDGLELAGRIRAEPANRALHLILLASGEVDPEAARRAGIAAVLSKPVRWSALFDCLVAVSPAGADGAGADGAGVDALGAAGPRAGAGPAAAPGRSATTGRARLLVAEDNEVNQVVAVGILSRLGYTADVAPDGRQALDMLAAGDYDAVLMDCQMPHLDGYETTAEIRRREGARQHTPVIAMTAAAFADDRRRALAAGMDDYISKPVTPADLEAVLSLWLPGSGSPVPVTAAVHDAVEGRMREFREIDPSGGLAAHIVESFRERVPRTLAAMGDAAAVPDPAELGRLAHSLGGMAGNVGATELAGLCARVEELVRSEALSGVERLLDDLAQAYERTCVALDEVSPTRL